jgi:hypothetical protein
MDNHDNGPFEAYVCVQLDSGQPLWTRIKTALKHVFGSACNYGDSAEVIVGRGDLDKIEAWVHRARDDAHARIANYYAKPTT